MGFLFDLFCFFPTVEETIPRGAFVDPDELRDLRAKTGLRSLVSAKVDIEKPEFEAEAYRVFLFRELVMRENLRVTTVQIPLNMRYHRPAPAPTAPGASGEHPSATVKIQNPRLEIRYFEVFFSQEIRSLPVRIHPALRIRTSKDPHLFAISGVQPVTLDDLNLFYKLF
jgi:hypothetical protein